MVVETIVFMAVGILLVAFAAVAVVSSILGVRNVTLVEPAEGTPRRGTVSSFQEKLAILNSK